MSDAASHQEAVARLVPPGVAVEVRTVKYTEEELNSLQERINQDRGFHDSLGIVVYYIGTDETRNIVELGISRYDETAAEALASRYGSDRVEIFVLAPPQLDVCTRSNCGPPWKGGLKIDNDVPGSCTSGFVVTSSSGNKYQWTAGHCGGPAGAITASSWEPRAAVTIGSFRTARLTPRPSTSPTPTQPTSS